MSTDIINISQTQCFYYKQKYLLYFTKGCDNFGELELISNNVSLINLLEKEFKKHYDDPNFHVGLFSTPEQRKFHYCFTDTHKIYTINCIFSPKFTQYNYTFNDYIMKINIDEQIQLI